MLVDHQESSDASSGAPRAGWMETGPDVTAFSAVNDLKACNAASCGRAAHAALQSMGFDLEHVLYANSTCPDEVNRKGPCWDSLFGLESSGACGRMTFNLGGLGGIPAVGKTGLGACASHVSDNKRRVIFVFCASHVGVSGTSVGKVRRAHQSKPSSCCGAAVGALKWAQATKILQRDPDDAQMDECKECVANNIERVGQDQAKLACVFYETAFQKLCSLIRAANFNHSCPVVVLGGIQLNTDCGQPDMLAPQHFVLFDTQSQDYVDKSDLFADELNNHLDSNLSSE